MEIIVKGDDAEELKKLKGKGITEFGKNLESEGFPSEFRNEEEQDKVKFLEKKLGRPVRKPDLKHFKDL